MADNMIYTGLDDQPINPVMDRIYFSPMDTLREGAEDVHVRKYVVYVGGGYKLFLEPERITQISQADMEYAFNRGMLLIWSGSSYIVPISIHENRVYFLGSVNGKITLMNGIAKATV